MTPQLWITIAGFVVSVGAILIGIGIAFGVVQTDIKHLKESSEKADIDLIKKVEDMGAGLKDDITRLEQKQDKYNHLQERVTRCEESGSSAHKRINRLENIKGV